MLDVASLLKQFLRELPEPVIPRAFHPILLSCHSSPRPLDSLQLALLLLPPDHLATLTFLLHHLARVATHSAINKMGAGNLAIVLSPNLLPCQEAARGGSKERKGDGVEARLKQHTALLETLLRNSSSMGLVTPELLERYSSCLSLPSYLPHSEGELLDADSSGCGAARRKVAGGKKKHVRRRSGSLSRVLGVVGRAMGLARATPGAKGEGPGAVHSTPLPVFGGTPAFPSPRGRSAVPQPKRGADGEHDLSPTKKVQRRTLESTFTPKMRKRSFSVKRFKRKKSETKMVAMKESLVVQAVEAMAAVCQDREAREGQEAGPRTRQSLAGTPLQLREISGDLRREREEQERGRRRSRGQEVRRSRGEQEVGGSPEAQFSSALEEDYAEVKAAVEELEDEMDSLEAETGGAQMVGQRYDAALAQGNMAR